MIENATSRRRLLLGGKFKWEEWRRMQKDIQTLTGKKIGTADLWGGVLDTTGGRTDIDGMRFTIKTFALMELVSQNQENQR